jgi:hypothetical protein
MTQFRILARAAVLLALSASALAQYGVQPIQWANSPAAASNIAQQTLRPIVIYVSADSESRATDLDERQQRALRHPDVVHIVTTYFVPLRLNRTTQTMPVLQRLGLPANFGGYLAVVPPETFAPNSAATKLAMIDAMSVADVGLLTRGLMNARRAYGEKLYGDQIRPLFEQEEIAPADLNKALLIISNYNIQSADKGVLAIFERHKDTKNRKLLKDLYDTLGTLSTPNSAQFLWEQAKAGSKEATDALTRLNPDTMERVLLPQLRSNDAADRYLAYKTLAKVLNLKPIKAEKWWENAREKQIEDEITKVTETLSQAAQQWRQGPGQFLR